ncbi:CopG family transcriptional regulator [Ochrobactrum sp. XJ1]|nr:CopG family transcriptional regulator [Ochrobactrum sp. XJ1]
MTSIINVPKKSRGRPSVDSERIVVRAQRAELDALDTFASDIEANSDAPLGRPEAIRRIISEWLRDKGYLPK